MRLINCETLELEEYFEGEMPEYAILSHTWGVGEVTFQDFARPERVDMLGWKKIEWTCKEALRYGSEDRRDSEEYWEYEDRHGETIRFAWVDTCCIDKTSSAELSEAINSMYRWYARSRICFAYLEDFNSTLPDSLQQCRWFSRGWTLQELLAPAEIRFYDRDAEFYGTKSRLGKVLSNITRIDERVLADPQHVFLRQVPICQKMSWAAKRETRRPEDLAYSLMGIFEVNMPLIYGEGLESAFMRLQEEIIHHHSNDLTLLAWQTNPGYSHIMGALAPSPRHFVDSGRIVLIRSLSGMPDKRQGPRVLLEPALS
ncbi:HET-domain-containing protein [Xylariomycetidae sp. FL2044]|nr:HET-domain-containing protein [Xylariomycetidae sp. FL2044]